MSEFYYFGNYIYTYTVHFYYYIVGLKTAANTGRHEVLVAEIINDIWNLVGHITNGSERLVDFGMVIGFFDAILYASLLIGVIRCIG